MGWEVDDVTAYRTVRAAPAQHVRDAIKGGDYDAVVFTSSSTARNLVGIAGKPHAATVVACIGPATAKTAQEHGLRVDVLAPGGLGGQPGRCPCRPRRRSGGRGRRGGTAGAAPEGQAACVAPPRPLTTRRPTVIERPRRLRQTATLRSLVAETRLHPRDLVLPSVRRGR